MGQIFISIAFEIPLTISYPNIMIHVFCTVEMLRAPKLKSTCVLWKTPVDMTLIYIAGAQTFKPADLEVPISTIWKIVENDTVGSWSRGNIALTSWKSAQSGNDRQWSGSQYDKVLLLMPPFHWATICSRPCRPLPIWGPTLERQ